MSTEKNRAYGFMGVEIEINHDCNRTCAYCPNSVLERKHQGRMSEKLFTSIMNQLAEIGYKGRISYHFYNEPLLSPDLDHFLGITKRILPECWVEILTNGTLLDAPRLHALLALGVDKFTVTEHHATAGSGTYPFRQVYEGLDAETLKKVRLVHYKDLNLTSRGGLVNAGYIKQKPPLDRVCFIPASVVVITVNGNVLPCFEDYQELNVMGNLGEHSLKEIWDCPKYVGFREDLKQKKRFAHPVCKDCNCVMVVM